MSEKLKLKRHESFLLREGWIQKYLGATLNETNIFSKNRGIEILGIGSNMVKSLKFWLQATGIIEGKSNNLTRFGRLLLDYDPYIESDFSISLIHYFLTKQNANLKDDEAPVFSVFFNNFRERNFTKEETFKFMDDFFKEKGFDFNEKSLEDDITILFRTYCNDSYDKNPEENYFSPLSKLNLLEKKDKNHYQKSQDNHNGINPLVILYALGQKYGKEKNFEIGDAFLDINSPIAIFNMDRNTFNQTLISLQKEKYITINKTAGLDMVYLDRKVTLEEIFALNFGGNE